MKIAVAVPVGLVLGLALGTTAGKIMAPAPVDSTVAADSSQVAENTTHAPVATDPPHVAVAVDSAGPDTTAHPAPSPTAAPATAAAEPGAADHKRLAGILDKLPGKDAAVLVAGLSDDELAGTLRVMDVAKAAGLIAALPPARGALMSKRLLEPGGDH